MSGPHSQERRGELTTIIQQPFSSSTTYTLVFPAFIQLFILSHESSERRTGLPPGIEPGPHTQKRANQPQDQPGVKHL